MISVGGSRQQCTDQDAGGVEENYDDGDDDDEGDDGDEDQDNDDDEWGLPVAVHRVG